jgi:hypothetical protein
MMTFEIISSEKRTPRFCLGVLYSRCWSDFQSCLRRGCFSGRAGVRRRSGRQVARHLNLPRDFQITRSHYRVRRCALKFFLRKHSVDCMPAPAEIYFITASPPRRASSTRCWWLACIGMDCISASVNQPKAVVSSLKPNSPSNISASKFSTTKNALLPSL